MDQTLDPLLQYGALGLCALGLGVLWYVIKWLLKIISNDLRHIQDGLDSLPCQRKVGCPESEKDDP